MNRELPFRTKVGNQLKDLMTYWPLLLIVGSLSLTVLAMAWPTMKAKLDIASRSEIVEFDDTLDTLNTRIESIESNNDILLRITALEANQAITNRNLAMITVLMSEATGRITSVESKNRLIQIAAGDYNQKELVNMLLGKD